MKELPLTAAFRSLMKKEYGVHFVDCTPQKEPYGTHLARKEATDDLKRLWDSYDGAETANPLISGEAVHMVLNERGEGKYCAV